MIQQKVGQRIRELRLKTGLSQEKLALKIGVDRTYLASVELGRRNVSVVNLEKIWNGLGISAEDFFSSSIFKDDENDKQQV